MSQAYRIRVSGAPGPGESLHFAVFCSAGRGLCWNGPRFDLPTADAWTRNRGRHFTTGIEFPYNKNPRRCKWKHFVGRRVQNVTGPDGTDFEVLSGPKPPRAYCLKSNGLRVDVCRGGRHRQEQMLWIKLSGPVGVVLGFYWDNAK